MTSPSLPSRPEFQRRPAADSDMERLFEINEAAIRTHVEANWGRAWDRALQRASFWETTKLETHEVFVCEEVVFGFWSVVRSPRYISLERISLLPAFQRRGIGTALIGELIAEAEAGALPVRLQVFPENPARYLYERLGFRHTESTEYHDRMEWRPTRGGERERAGS